MGGCDQGLRCGAVRLQGKCHAGQCKSSRCICGRAFLKCPVNLPSYTCRACPVEGYRKKVLALISSSNSSRFCFLALLSPTIFCFCLIVTFRVEIFSILLFVVFKTACIISLLDQLLPESLIPSNISLLLRVRSPHLLTLGY